MTKTPTMGSRFLRSVILSGRLLTLASILTYASLGCGNDAQTKGNQSTTGGTRNVTCTFGKSPGEVQAPQYKMTISGETSWFASPVIRDLDGDGQKELI